MNTNHWRKILKQNPDVTKTRPTLVPGRTEVNVCSPMKPETMEKLENLKKKMGIK